MKKAILLLLLFFTVAINFFGQIIDTAFYSPSLDEVRNVDVYLPPGYNSNQSLYYPVIYVFHGWSGSENSAITIMNETVLLINSGTIDPLIIVCANNSPTPFLGSFFVNSSLFGDYEEFNTVYQKWQTFDPATYIDQLLPEDSVAILFGAGQNDELSLYQPNVAFKDSLDKYDLTYEFFDHAGSHGMPAAFKTRGLIFLDSVMRVSPNYESCLQPSELIATSVTNTSAYLDWTENGSSSSWEIL